MRVVADTNTVISALLWKGAPRKILNLARDNIMELCNSMILLTELENVLVRDKFIERLNLVGAKPRELVLGYASLATIIQQIIFSTSSSIFFTIDYLHPALHLVSLSGVV